MKYKILINPETLYWDCGIYEYMCGPEEILKEETYILSPDKEWILTSQKIIKNQPTQTIYGIPGWRCDYFPSLVMCEECGDKFDWTELGYDEEDDYSWKNICPKCGISDCCEIEKQNVNELPKELLTKAKEKK